jgi:hypothetical protein
LASDRTRVQAAALEGLVKLGAKDIDRRLFDALIVPDLRFARPPQD